LSGKFFGKYCVYKETNTKHAYFEKHKRGIDFLLIKNYEKNNGRAATPNEGEGLGWPPFFSVGGGRATISHIPFFFFFGIFLNAFTELTHV
jgi:hypothetical protein